MNQSLEIHPGWNMVGYPSLENRMRDEALNDLEFGPDVTAIWTYDSSIQQWMELGSSEYFEPGRGYIMHSNLKATWIVPL